jgi:hypothetical protein
MAPNDPDSGDPQSIPIDNYTGSSRRKNMGSEDIPVTSHGTPKKFYFLVMSLISVAF